MLAYITSVYIVSRSCNHKQYEERLKIFATPYTKLFNICTRFHCCTQSNFIAQKQNYKQLEDRTIMPDLGKICGANLL